MQLGGIDRCSRNMTGSLWRSCRIRDEQAAAHDDDQARIVADLREEEGASDAVVVTLNSSTPELVPRVSGG
jgi:hypothetical protein